MRDEALRREIARVHEDNYSVLGARKMHVMRGRPEIAERHGAGHVARCTVERLMGDLGLHGIRRAKSPCTTRSAPREQCPADLVRRHFEAFALNELCGVLTFSRKREVPPPMYAPSPGGSTAPSSPTCTRGGSSAGSPPPVCTPTWP